uniref:Uncharacterized protein n=1 Tax=Branchiostoma floridae TaxID=7739 RepID=C3ZXZ7_BRAFL|eukprot:XP_002586563.1 hypothetical protein BRAFLDRAFT_131383 [Branchiostoma floridae]
MASAGGQEGFSRAIFLTSIINDTCVLVASVSDCAPTRRDLGRFTVPFQEKGSGCDPRFIQLYDLNVYTIDQLRHGQFKITALESLEDKARQEVEETYAYILQDNDAHFNYVVRHMKKYRTEEGQTAIILSCRELNRVTGRPIVLIKELRPVVPQQIDESRLVIRANQRGEELTADEETLAIDAVRQLLKGLPDCELNPTPPFGNQANPARIRRKLSNNTEVQPRFTCSCPVPVYRGRQPAKGILGSFYMHRMPGWLGCGGKCPSCRYLLKVLGHAVKCADAQCHHKELLVKDYIGHVLTDCKADPCNIPFCRDSKHLIYDRGGELRVWVTNDVIENIRRTTVS